MPDGRFQVALSHLGIWPESLLLGGDMNMKGIDAATNKKRQTPAIRFQDDETSAYSLAGPCRARAKRIRAPVAKDSR